MFKVTEKWHVCPSKPSILSFWAEGEESTAFVYRMTVNIQDDKIKNIQEAKKTLKVDLVG